MPEIILNYTYTVKCERRVTVPDDDWDEDNVSALAFNGDYENSRQDEIEQYYDDPLFEIDSHGVENLTWRRA